MAGISHATLVIEATMRSGTLITSSLAGQYSRDVFALPGSIFSTLSEGPHMLISKGAAIIRSSEDILKEFEIEVKNPIINVASLSPEDKKVFGILTEPLEKEILVHRLVEEESLHVRDIHIQLSLMELGGLITEESGIIRRSKKYP
jgi:DNA processing protein